jgi:hypothetical protein
LKKKYRSETGPGLDLKKISHEAWPNPWKSIYQEKGQGWPGVSLHFMWPALAQETGSAFSIVPTQAAPNLNLTRRKAHPNHHAAWTGVARMFQDNWASS